MFEKYFNSDIFNTGPIKVEKIPTVRVRQSQTSLANTKNDIFNTDKKAQNTESFMKKLFNRKSVYSKIYGSDIFNQTNPTESKINKNNFSTCFDNMKNNEEYKKSLQSYAKEKRAEKKKF